MRHKTLLTLDLDKATSNQRGNFYEILKDKQWKKINEVSTSWKASFKNELKREEIEEIILMELLDAKDSTGVPELGYAFQINLKGDVKYGRL